MGERFLGPNGTYYQVVVITSQGYGGLYAENRGSAFEHDMMSWKF